MKFALLGHHISYSSSPAIHKKIAGEDFHYQLLDISPDKFDITVENILPGFDGFNVTSPYKLRIMPYCDKFDPPVNKIGAVNTILNKKNEWKGFNTDYLGFLRSFRESFPDFLSYHPVVIGYGGAARAAIFALQELGFNTAGVFGGEEKEERMAFIRSENEQLRIKLMDILPDMPKIWINCTPLGSEKIPAVPEGLIPFCSDDFLYDLNYAPNPSHLEKYARKKGVKTVNGLRMLVYQAVEAQKIWLGKEFFLKTDIESILRSLDS